MTKERNYTIEFYRIMFAINFCLIHVLLVFPMFVFGSNIPFFAAGLDIIIPFMAFAGYFLMQGFAKQREAAKILQLSPQRQAWDYLKARLVGLGPAYLVASLGGWVMLNVWKNTRLADWPIHLLNSTFELLGLQISGAGFGNPSVGTAWYPAPGGMPPVQMLASPLWFISGIFVAGYIVYFLLAYNKKLFLGLIAPVVALLFYASHYLTGVQPMWYNVTKIGEFSIAQGLPEMFVGLSLGCMLYVAVDKLRGKKWSKGAIAGMTVLQIILTFIVLVRSWVPIFLPFGQYFNLDWANVHLLSLIFTFLVLLNVDKCTRFPLFSSKIWKTPGRMAFYFYMLHWPIIYIVALAMGMRGLDLSYITADNIMQELPRMLPQFALLFGITVVVSLIVAYLFMKLDTKVIQPWLKSKPWYNKEQKELEQQEIERQRRLVEGSDASL